MKKTLITLTALTLVGFMAATAFAWGHGGGKRGGCGRGEYGMFSDLSQEQKTELRALHQQFIDETYDTRSAMMTKHQEIRMLMETSNPDRAKLDTLSDDILALKKAMVDKRIDYALKAKEIAPELNLMAFGRHHGSGKGGYGGGKGGYGPCPWNNGGEQTVQ